MRPVRMFYSACKSIQIYHASSPASFYRRIARFHIIGKHCNNAVVINLININCGARFTLNLLNYLSAGANNRTN